MPGLAPQFAAFPSGAWSSARRYAVFFQGDTPLTQHLLTPAMIAPRTGALADTRIMPATMAALMLSKPLHFGDYGGLPMKLLRALLDLVTIWVLVSGLFLWLPRAPGLTQGRIREIANAGRSSDVL